MSHIESRPVHASPKGVDAARLVRVGSRSAAGIPRVALAAVAALAMLAPMGRALAVDATGLAQRLAAAAPRLEREVLALATRALACSARHGVKAPATLGVIDYSRPSTVPRMWVFDLADDTLLYEELVSHGRGSGDGMATRFSNVEGSHMSSLGAFETQETYTGINGYSLRLRGLEPGINDQARARAIVIHGADYVSAEFARQQGRLGRSLGCPAVRSDIARPLIDSIAEGSFLFVYYPDASWLRSSALLQEDCATR